ncbi:hypothetical protein C943_01339 [Mariniradius saccharolyticus AK6]|uniref:Fibronectin type-III domain-containing protein n=1 Tax=Mariniradius saccharolyticus AK6 TaxID=1239962 RepID=M7XUA2_9BACT|nr:hypothetical protein C943_01339 [Mariniradius saccharolyticus AK6]
MKAFLLTIFGIVFSAISFAQQPRLAFPGAEGFGKYTSGGRGGKVYIVTNLNDSGPGSLREALESTEPRTVVFEVSGNIELKSSITIRNGNLTIAGQTAPGDGVTLKNYPMRVFGSQNLIIRFIRFRLGDLAKIEADAFEARDGSLDLIIDHCSFSWGTDETCSVYRVKNTTVQNCIIAEGINDASYFGKEFNHAYGGIWGGENVSFFKNLISHFVIRSPSIASNTNIADLRNNVIYNWNFRSTNNGENANANFISNYYKPGPATKFQPTNTQIANFFLWPTGPEYGKFYLEGNKLEGKTILEQDQWLGVRLESGDLTEQYLEQLKNKDQNGSLVPFPVPSHIYSKTMTADEAYESVLAAAGASLVRDAVDKRIVQEVKTGTVTFKGSKNGLLGIIDSQNDVGGWPVLQSLPAPKDTDRDGMPDAWETEHGLNPNSYNPNGYNLDQNYTNLEVYLNSLVSHIMEPGNEEIVAVSGVSVDPKTATIDAGKTVQVTATIQPSNASNKQVTWSSSNTAIATVNGSGLVTGIAPGSVVITAKTSDGGFTATSTITVNQTTLPSIVNLVLVDAGDNNDFSVLSNNMVLDNSKIFGKTWNVRANSNPSSIGSVYFSLTGPLVATRTENSAPYALFGDSDGVYQGRELPAGKYVIEAIPYSGSNRSGSVGATYRIEFEIKDLPPSAPALVSPANQALGQELTGMLQWEDVATASNYRVQVSESSSFSTLVVDQGSLMDNQFSYTLPNSGTKYYWRVMARNGTGNSGWSSIWSFTTKTSVQVPGIPVLSAPAKDSSIPVGKTTFSWNTVSGAEKYRLQVSKEAQFNSPTYDVYNLPGTSVELDVKDPGTYYWRVSASNQGGSGAFSTASTFQTIAPPTPPTLVAPNNQSLDLSTSVLLTWAAVSNATSYRVQVATVQDFSQVQRDVSNISSTQLQLDNLSEGVTYYWRVRAGNMAGTSSYSTVWEFSTKRPLTPPAAPVLLTPSSNAVVATGKVLFSWQGVSNANSCRLQVAKDAQFSSPIHDSGNHTNTSIELELLAAGTYFWRVSASNQAGSSPFSAARSFETLNPPSTPQLASPNNQSLDQAISVLLSWSAASNASSYRVQVATVRDFSQVLRDVSNVSATQLQVDNLAEGVTYYWRVRASNPVGNSNYSTTWEFSTKKALTVPATPILSSPSNSSVLKKEPVQMQWQSVATADDYQIQISLSSNFSQQILVNVQGISGTSFQFQDLAYNTVYFWRVRARNAAGFGPYSSIRSFKTEAEPQLAAAILRSPAKNGLIESDQVEFKWSPVPEATSYTLYLSQDSLFKSGQSILRSISDTSLLVSDLQRDKNYFWKIEALGAKKSSFSETWKFAIEKEKETEVFQYRRVDINLYPNPATDFINLSFSEFVSGKVLIQFLDSRGTLVLAREFENVGNELRWDFSGQNIPSGKYFLRIQGEWFVETKQVWIK